MRPRRRRNWPVSAPCAKRFPILPNGRANGNAPERAKRTKTAVSIRLSPGVIAFYKDKGPAGKPASMKPCGRWSPRRSDGDCRHLAQNPCGSLWRRAGSPTPPKSPAETKSVYGCSIRILPPALLGRKAVAPFLYSRGSVRLRVGVGRSVMTVIAGVALWGWLRPAPRSVIFTRMILTIYFYPDILNP
jgi:hypothetical protein